MILTVPPTVTLPFGTLMKSLPEDGVEPGAPLSRKFIVDVAPKLSAVPLDVSVSVPGDVAVPGLNVARFATVTAPASVFPTCSVPRLTAVVPVYVFAPFKISVPGPFLTRLPAPPLSATIPAYVTVAPLSTVSEPVPFTSAMPRLALNVSVEFSSRFPPLPSAILPAVGMTGGVPSPESAPTASVPALIVVGPE